MGIVTYILQSTKFDLLFLIIKLLVKQKNAQEFQHPLK